MAIKSKYKDQIVLIIQKHLPECKVYLFGSQATGKSHAGSDIDLGLDNGFKIPRKIILNILIDIDQTVIPMKIDLVDMHSAQESIKLAIIKEGILWTN